MSVTFEIAVTEADMAGFSLVCGCGAKSTGVLAASHREVEAYRAADPRGVAPVCHDDFCAADTLEVGGYIQVEFSVPGADGADVDLREVAVNVSNGSATHLLPLLGIEASTMQSGGSVPAEDFLGRVLLAMAVAPADEGVPAHSLAGPGARFVDCGRPEGYTERVLDTLHALALAAVSAARDVQWT